MEECRGLECAHRNSYVWRFLDYRIDCKEIWGSAHDNFADCHGHRASLGFAASDSPKVVAGEIRTSSYLNIWRVEGPPREVLARRCRDTLKNSAAVWRGRYGGVIRTAPRVDPQVKDANGKQNKRHRAREDNHRQLFRKARR